MSYAAVLVLGILLGIFLSWLFPEEDQDTDHDHNSPHEGARGF